MIDLPKEDNIKDMTCNGNCSRCGNCCGLFIPFNDEDLPKIKKYVKQHNIKQENRLNIMTGQFEARCCFYDKVNKKCNIYEVRPYVCRDFICNRKNWRDKRDEYEMNCTYNSSLKPQLKMGTFDDLIYGDYEPLTRFVMGMIYDITGGIIDEKIC